LVASFNRSINVSKSKEAGYGMSDALVKYKRLPVVEFSFFVIYLMANNIASNPADSELQECHIFITETDLHLTTLLEKSKSMTPPAGTTWVLPATSSVNRSAPLPFAQRILIIYSDRCMITKQPCTNSFMFLDLKNALNVP
jgi:hypothetical protein